MNRQQEDRLHEVFGFLERYMRDNGFAPTCEEIRRALGLSSRSHAAYYLSALEEAGRIERIPRSPRGVKLLPALRSTRETGTERHPSPNRPRTSTDQNRRYR